MVMELCDGSLHQALHGTNRFFSVQHSVRLAVRILSQMWPWQGYRLFTGSAAMCMSLFLQEDIASGMRFLHSLTPAVIHR